MNIHSSMMKPILAALTLSASAALVCASPLSDLLEQHELGWIIGKWSADSGGATLSYQWKVDKNAIGVSLTMGEREAEGMIALKPGTTEAKYMAVDSKGAVSMGQWAEHNGHPTLKVKTATTEGETRSMAAEHIKVDEDTMKVIVHRMDESGEVGEQVMEVEFRRQK